MMSRHSSTMETRATLRRAMTATTRATATASTRRRARRETRRRAASRGNADFENDEKVDVDDERSAYEILGVKPTASREEIRRRFVSLSKRYHPDLRAESSRDDGTMMRRINAAYATLSSDDERRAHDASLRAKPREKNDDGRTVIYEGLVGPIVSNEVASLDVCPADACPADVAETMADAIRQWARTLAFTSELPLPLPLSVDDVPGGARLAFMRYSANSGLREAGALRIHVAEDDAGTRVLVSRSCERASSAAQMEIPGESRVLASFMEEFRYILAEDAAATSAATAGRRRGDEQDWLGDIASAFAAFILPGLPMFGATGRAPGGAYAAYNLKNEAKHID
jgi:hypothetical protein